MEPNILKYVWKHSRKQQLWMLVVILASMPTYFLSLELPKRIVNGPIQGTGFENPGATGTFMEIWMPYGKELFGHPVRLFSGFDLNRIDYLLALSLSFLALVAINGLFKMYINTYKGRVGERIMRRLRYELFDRVLRYPLSRFRRMKASEVSSMIKDEVEPMGEFIGDAFTQPLFLGGQALTGLAFIFLQNLWLGTVTLVVVAFQGWLIPYLRKRLIALGKQRQIEARILAGKIGEAVDGIRDIHANDNTNYQRSLISAMMGKLYFIRFEYYQRKFSIKFVNNFLMQFLAFFFYAVGGYLAIRGTIDIGQLLGVIVAYKDLPEPIRALIDYDQRRLVVEARYNQIIDQFSADELQPLSHFVRDGRKIPEISSGYEFSNTQIIDETGARLIENLTTSIGLGEKVAVIGGVASGAREFGELCAGFLPIESGRATLSGAPLADWPEYVLGRQIAYMDGNTYFPQGTIYDVLTRPLMNEPQPGPGLVEIPPELRKRNRAEAIASGNSTLDFNANWIDFAQCGVTGETELRERVMKLVKAIGFEDDLHTLGLKAVLNEERQLALASRLIEARGRFRERLKDDELAQIIEPFEPDRYNNRANIAENLLFGTSIHKAYKPENLATNPFINQELRHSPALHQLLFEIGLKVAETTVEIFGELSPDDAFFDHLTYMSPEEIPHYRALLNRIRDVPLAQINRNDESMILRLAFSYDEGRNRIGLLDDPTKAQIVDARHALRKTLEGFDEEPVSFYEPDRYNPHSSVMDNILLGRVADNVADAGPRISRAIRQLLEEMELTGEINNVGLDYNVGSGGKRLTDHQSQRLHVARVLLKNPRIVIANQALTTLDRQNQQMIIENLDKLAFEISGTDVTVIAVLINAIFAPAFDRVLVFENGRLVGDDTPDRLAQSCEQYRGLVGL